MSDVIVKSSDAGARAVINAAREALNTAAKAAPVSCGVSFPETNYYLPLSFALCGKEVKTLSDCGDIVVLADDLSKGIPLPNGLSVNALGGILNKGIATLLCEEVLAALSV